jgi:xylulokinase
MAVLGIDLGTSATKVLVVDSEGMVCGVGHGDHRPVVPRSGWSEQDPEDWWRSTLQAVAAALEGARLDPTAIDAVGLAGQMHGLVALDAQGDCIRPAQLWNDGRCESQCRAVEDRLGLAHLLACTGNRMLPGFTAPKLLWMREHEPEAFARIATVLLPKDWIRFRLTGALATDVSDASGTAVFDCAQRRWSDALLADLKLPRSWWPEAVESAQVVGQVQAQASALIGLRPGTPVVAGAGDQAAAALGCGLVQEGSAGAVLGTSGVVAAPMQRWRSADEGRLHAFCHAAPGTWFLMGVMLSGAGSLDWFRRAIMPDFSDDDAFERIEAMAAGIAAGADDLFFLPYLSGERTPHADASARGCFIGLDQRHDRRHLARAVLEGVTHGLSDCFGLLREAGLDPRCVHLSGGGTRSVLWRQLCADLFSCPVVLTDTVDATAYGAALLAAVGAGAFASAGDACEAWVTVAPPLLPGPEAPRLQERHALHKQLYPALKPVFAQLSSAQP